MRSYKDVVEIGKAPFEEVHIQSLDGDLSGEVPQQIMGMGKTVKPITMSRHNSFKGMLGRGRGRQGSPQAFSMKGRGVTGHTARVSRGVGLHVIQDRPHPQSLRNQEELRGDIGAGLSAQNKDPFNKAASLLNSARKANKRKPSLQLQIPSRPIQKRPLKKQIKEPVAGMLLDSEGFYKVTIQQAHIQELGAGCGVGTEAVIQALNVDNAERRTNQINLSENIPTEEEMDESNARFDLDPEDEEGETDVE